MDVDRLFRPPTHCPRCGTGLVVPRLTHSRLARRLRIAAIAVTPVWILAVLSNLAFDPDRVNGGTDWMPIVLLSAPMSILLGWSFRLRRVLPFECRHCGWRHEFGASKDGGLFDPAQDGLKKDGLEKWDPW